MLDHNEFSSKNKGGVKQEDSGSRFGFALARKRGYAGADQTAEHAQKGANEKRHPYDDGSGEVSDDAANGSKHPGDLMARNNVIPDDEQQPVQRYYGCADQPPSAGDPHARQYSG